MMKAWHPRRKLSQNDKHFELGETWAGTARKVGG